MKKELFNYFNMKNLFESEFFIINFFVFKHRKQTII